MSDEENCASTSNSLNKKDSDDNWFAIISEDDTEKGQEQTDAKTKECSNRQSDSTKTQCNQCKIVVDSDQKSTPEPGKKRGPRTLAQVTSRNRIAVGGKQSRLAKKKSADKKNNSEDDVSDSELLEFTPKSRKSWREFCKKGQKK